MGDNDRSSEDEIIDQVLKAIAHRDDVEQVVIAIVIEREKIRSVMVAIPVDRRGLIQWMRREYDRFIVSKILADDLGLRIQ